MNIQRMNIKAKYFPVPWHVRTYHRRVHYFKSTSHRSKIEETETPREEGKVYQTRGEYHGTKTGQESPEKEEKEAY